MTNSVAASSVHEATDVGRLDQDDVAKKESPSFVRFLQARRAAEAEAHHIIQLR